VLSRDFCSSAAGTLVFDEKDFADAGCVSVGGAEVVATRCAFTDVAPSVTPRTWSTIRDARSLAAGCTCGSSGSRLGGLRCAGDTDRKDRSGAESSWLESWLEASVNCPCDRAGGGATAHRYAAKPTIATTMAPTIRRAG